MPNNPDIERDEIENYKPPVWKTTKFGIAAMWVILIAVSFWNQSSTPVNTFWYLGGMLCSIVTFSLLYGPEVVRNHSPKVISFLHGDSIRGPHPPIDVPESPGLPRMGIWLPGTTDAPELGISVLVGAKEILVVPIELGYTVGRNLFTNCYTQAYVDHSQLPPPIYAKLQDWKYYRPDMIVEFGEWPQLVHEPTKLQIDQYKKELNDFFEPLGIKLTKDNLETMYLLMERWACTVSPFKYDGKLTDVEQNAVMREQATNKENVELQKLINHYKSELQDAKGFREKPKEPTMLDQLTRRDNGRDREDDQRRDE